MRDRGWVEFSVYPLFARSRSSPKGARTSASKSLSPEESASPSSKRSSSRSRASTPALAEQFATDPGARGPAGLRGERGRTPVPRREDRRRAAAEWIARYALWPKARAEQRVRFIGPVPQLRHQLQRGPGHGAPLRRVPGGSGCLRRAALARARSARSRRRCSRPSWPRKRARERSRRARDRRARPARPARRHSASAEPLATTRASRCRSRWRPRTPGRPSAAWSCSCSAAAATCSSPTGLPRSRAARRPARRRLAESGDRGRAGRRRWRGLGRRWSRRASGGLGGPRVPVRHPGPRRRDADPERGRLRPGSERDDRERAVLDRVQRAARLVLRRRMWVRLPRQPVQAATAAGTWCSRCATALRPGGAPALR